MSAAVDFRIGGRAHPGESRTVLIGSYIGSRWFQCVPIVSNSRENANACQHTAEHVNVLYERGVATHQCSYAFPVLGAGHIQGNVLNPDLNV